MTSDELWKPIPGWEGRYSVSDQGRVRSEKRIVDRVDGRTQLFRERLLTLVPDGKGYLRVQLFRENLGFTRYVHQLVMSAFVGPQPKDLVTRHLNGDKVDNRLVNLTYGTDSENKQDTVRHGTHRNSKKTHCIRNHPFDAQNTYLTSDNRRVCRSCMRTRQRKAYRSSSEVRPEGSRLRGSRVRA